LFRVTRNTGGTITAATADFQANFQGFPAGSSVTIAHIHPGDASSTGGIVVNTGLTAGEVQLTNGAGSFTKNGINVSPEVAQNILSSPANFYFNIHSALNAPGVLRGQMDGSGAPADPGQKPPPGPDPDNPYPDPPGVR
jgi:hypothetical protein